MSGSARKTVDSIVSTMVARATVVDDARKQPEKSAAAGFESRFAAATCEVGIHGISTAVTLVCWTEPKVPLAERNSSQLDRFIPRR
jgi:hypothetical protein